MLFLLNVPKWLLQLVPHLRNTNEEFRVLEKVNFLSVATVLDPWVKEAVVGLTDESTEDVPQEKAATSASASEKNYNLWALLDIHVESQHHSSSVSSSAMVEIQRYLKEQHLARADDPLKSWAARRTFYPQLETGWKYPCIPASSVRCERMFSKAGEPEEEQTEYYF